MEGSNKNQGKAGGQTSGQARTVDYVEREYNASASRRTDRGNLAGLNERVDSSPSVAKKQIK